MSQRIESLKPRKHVFRLPLLATASAIVFVIAVPDTRYTRFVEIALLASAVLLTLHASEADRMRRHIAAALVVLSALMSTYGTAVDDAHWVRGVGEFISVLPVAWAAVTVIRWIARQHMITGEAVVAGILVYLLIALMFAAIYGGLADIDSKDFFCSPHGDGTSSERTYFSLTTITTTGYGDFVSCTQAGRAFAVSEAVFGQVYLVTIISLLVGNMGRVRRRREDIEGSASDDSPAGAGAAADRLDRD